MKAILILTTILIINACTTKYETTTKYFFSNESNHKVDVFISNASIVQGVYNDTTIKLNPTESFEYLYLYEGTGSAYTIPFGRKADSVCISFFETIVIDTITIDTIIVGYLKRDTSSRNPLNIENYTGGIKGSSCKTCDVYEYSYAISEKDYENALEILMDTSLHK